MLKKLKVVKNTLFENYRISRIQHRERSELCLHIETLRGHRVLPDRSVLIWQKLVENTKVKEIKMRHFGGFFKHCTSWISLLCLLWWEISATACTTTVKKHLLSASSYLKLDSHPTTQRTNTRTKLGKKENPMSLFSSSFGWWGCAYVDIMLGFGYYIWDIIVAHN